MSATWQVMSSSPPFPHVLTQSPCLSDLWPVAPSRPLSPKCRSQRSRERDGVSSQGGISTSGASVCQQLSLAWISFCIQLRTFIPVESSSAWHWGPAVLLRAQWFMYCWVRAAGSSQRSPGRLACLMCLCVCVYEKVCMSHCRSANTNVCVYVWKVAWGPKQSSRQGASVYLSWRGSIRLTASMPGRVLVL